MELARYSFHVEQCVMSANLIQIEDEVSAFIRPLPERAKIILTLEAQRRRVPLAVVVKQSVLTVAETVLERAAGPQNEAA
jgi:hypothetical protein